MSKDEHWTTLCLSYEQRVRQNSLQEAIECFYVVFSYTIQVYSGDTVMMK